jgi:uncharacterized protein
MEEYQPGIPSWADLSTPDPDAAAEFYAELFGWQITKQRGGAGYRVCRLRRKPVAGISNHYEAGSPPAWLTYVDVEDADATIEAVRRASGDVLMKPADVPPGGRKALFEDPTGAVCAVWEADTFPGAALVNEPGTLRKNDLNTRQPEVAMQFYRAVFGWTTVEERVNQKRYFDWHIHGRAVAGLMPMDDSWPADVPSHWVTYFEVADCEHTAATLDRLGGTILVPPTDSGPGIFSVVSDPQGAVFDIIQMNH